MDAHNECLAAVGQIHADTGALLREFESAREDMVAEQRERLAAEVGETRSDTAASLKGLKSARQAMAAEQCERLASEVGAIASQVAETRSALQADLAGARREWRKFARARQRSTGRSEGALPERASADDLTEIKGLGPATQRRLQNAGILTFPQLAGCTPEELQGRLGDTGPRLKVAEWIKQARKLAA